MQGSRDTKVNCTEVGTRKEERGRDPPCINRRMQNRREDEEARRRNIKTRRWQGRRGTNVDCEEIETRKEDNGKDSPRMK